LLPDPEKQPGEFREARELWNALRQLGHGFVIRPRISSRFAELNSRYLANVATARRELEHLIRTDAPAADFEKAWRRFPEKPSSAPRFPVPSNSIPGPSAQFDLRSLIAKRVPPKEFKATEYKAFELWLRFKQGEELDDTKEVMRAAAGIELSRSDFSTGLADFLTKRVSTKLRDFELFGPDEKLSPHKLTDDAIRDLIDTLVRKTGLKPLADAWRTVADPRIRMDSAGSSDFESAWIALAITETDADFYGLRERAARQALKFIASTPADKSADMPVTMLLVDALEESCAVGAKAQVRRLLILDRAYGGLTPELHREYESISEQMPDVANPRSDAERSDATGRYRVLLSQSTSPGAARYAAEQLKRLRQKTKTADSKEVRDSN
jgi:hypothetical protein